jgi:hypothetical protein
LINRILFESSKLIFTWQEGLLAVSEHPFAVCAIGLFQASIVGNVFALRHTAVDVQPNLVSTEDFNEWAVLMKLSTNNLKIKKKLLSKKKLLKKIKKLKKN